jgi:hypothetical protein
VRVFEGMLPWLVGAAPQAAILIAANPPEPPAEIKRNLPGHEHVSAPVLILTGPAFLRGVHCRDWSMGAHNLQ